MKDEHDIPVVPYLCYDALMERFERSQKNLRISMLLEVITLVGLIIALVCR